VDVLGHEISLEQILLTVGSVVVVVSYLLKKNNSNFSEIESLKNAWKDRDVLNQQEMQKLRDNIDNLHLKIDKLVVQQKKERESYKRSLLVWENESIRKDIIIKNQKNTISELITENELLRQ